ncbi:uncharacterized protein N7458_001711 [Penicillium daleae]|uniref:Alpha box domain-containing protein n=1 Tax=Penicillium daleae TaxID=63821 RepID=A0AAD6CC74_9EURO|nr:uncharacterized protein N7458_001711 [Penicillium daleae]KAJ5460159.1 hypothetical protein N7458_001711 [Penicillium daleae]
MASAAASPTLGPIELEFISYLSMIPFHRAGQILDLCPSDMSFHEFATLIMDAFPDNYLDRGRPFVSGHHVEFVDGRPTAVPEEGDHPTIAPMQTLPGPSYKPRGRGARPPPKQLRPLNSFLAFRGKYQIYSEIILFNTNKTLAYIATALPAIPQKKKSILIAQFWKDEPHKGQWSLIATAYTTVRNNFAVFESSVPTFADIVARNLFGFPPLISISPCLGGG